ncbi:hypothetical protein WMF30_03650 [Sorangium sp. So ce134]
MWKNQYLLAMALCAGALSTLGMGCELIATVDRSRIPGNEGATDACADGTKNGDETDVDCGGTCAPCDLAKACSKTEDCSSGFCADGVCCDAACDEECDACTAELKGSGEDGKCGPTKAETECGEATCSEGVQTARGTCNGEDVECEPGEETSCETFACDPEANACFAECSEDAQCATCHVCDGDACSLAPAGTPHPGCEDDQLCNATGECKAGNGQECADAADCGSGSCVDGVCCDTACDSPCKSCNVAGSEGTCSDVPLGEEDGTDCSDLNVCDGAGACKLAPGERCATDDECASGDCISAVFTCAAIPQEP